MLEVPSLRNLEARVAKVLVAGSPAFDSFVARVQELVALGDQVVPNDPDLLSVTVENVELVGAAAVPPGDRHRVRGDQSHSRSRRRRTHRPATRSRSPARAVLEVTRFEEPVRLTEQRLASLSASPDEGIGFVQGETTCPPA